MITPCWHSSHVAVQAAGRCLGSKEGIGTTGSGALCLTAPGGKGLDWCSRETWWPAVFSAAPAAEMNLREVGGCSWLAGNFFTPKITEMCLGLSVAFFFFFLG